MEIIVFLLMIAGLTSWIAVQRGRSGVVWFFLGVFLSVFALVAVLAAPSLAAQGSSPVPRDDRPAHKIPDPIDRRPAVGSLPRWSARANKQFSQQVMGEAQYQAALARHVPKRDPDGVRIGVGGVLVPEPDNPHDPNAVQVRLGGAVVGYLPREDAELWVGMLAQRRLTGQTVRVWGEIIGGQDIERRGVLVAANYGLMLDMDPVYDVVDLRPGR